MTERADILVEQFRPGVMERLGLGYVAMRKINPAIIYCSVTDCTGISRSQSPAKISSGFRCG